MSSCGCNDGEIVTGECRVAMSVLRMGMSDRISEIVRHSYESMEANAPRPVKLTPQEIEAALSLAEGVYPVRLDHCVGPLQRKLREALPSPEGPA